MYLLIEDTTDYYRSEESTIYDDFDSFLDAAATLIEKGTFEGGYKIAESWYSDSIQEVIRERVQLRNQAIEAAKAKLTPEECRLLGIS